MTKVKQLQTQICELDKNMDRLTAKFESRKIDVIEYTKEIDMILDKQAALTSEVAKLRLEDFKRGEV